MKNPEKWSEELWKCRELLNRSVAYAERAASRLGRMPADKERKPMLLEIVKKIEGGSLAIMGAGLDLGAVEVADKEDDDG